MATSAIQSRTIMSTTAAVVLIAFLTHITTADEMYRTSSSSSETAQTTSYGANANINSIVVSFFNGQFKGKLQLVGDELDKFKNSLRSNRNGITSPSINETLSEIEDHIDLARQSIEEFKVDYPSDTDYASKIINLQSNAIALQMSLMKLNQDRSASSQIVNIDNAVVEKAHNLVKLLNSCNLELDNLREKIDAENTAKRLRDEIGDDIKRDVIDNLQKTIENQMKKQQQEMSRFKEELRDSFEKQVDREKRQLLQEVDKMIIDRIGNYSQKEKDITNTLHTSLENQMKELRDEINRNKEQLLNGQKVIEQNERNNTNNVQMLLDNLREQVQNHDKIIERNSVAILQKTMENQIKTQQEAMSSIKEELRNVTDKTNDLQNNYIQKEKNITNALHTSFENQRKELRDEINRNKGQLLDGQKIIEEKVKNWSENVQTTLDNLNGQMQNFKHELDDIQKNFTRKEKSDAKTIDVEITDFKRRFDNLQEKIARNEKEIENLARLSNNLQLANRENEVYEHQVSYFGALMVLPHSVPFTWQKYNLYRVLHDEAMKINNRPKAWVLNQLGNLLKREILDQPPDFTSNWAKSLYDNISNEVRNSSVELISAAFKNDHSWPMAAQLSADICARDNWASGCNFDIYRDVIEIVWNEVTLDDLLQKTGARFVYQIEVMSIHRALINKLKNTRTLTSDSAKTIASSMKKEIERGYHDLPKDWQIEYEKLYDDVKNL